MDYKSKTANDKEISIYYFSATGNSLKLSQDIAAAFGGAGLFRMTPSAGITASDSRIVGFIFPVYMGGLPGIVRRFLESYPFRKGVYYCKYSINSLVYWVTYVHNVVYSFYRSMIYCYINSTQRCAGSIVIDIIPTNGADKRKFFPFAPYFPVTNVIKRYFYPYFPAIIGIKGYSFPYFPYLSGIMKIKTALYSLFSRLDWHKTVVFPCLGEIYEGIRSLSWEIPVT